LFNSLAFWKFSFFRAVLQSIFSFFKTRFQFFPFLFLSIS
jgi:hypothetical protein